jgi:hypothetical protein
VIRCIIALSMAIWFVAGTAAGAAPPPGAKRIAFLVESWYPWSHADVIGSRFLSGYRIGDAFYQPPVTVASVYAEAPRATDQTRVLAAQHGFRVADSVAEALLDDPRRVPPRLAVDGILIATREDLRERGGLTSPTPRLQMLREVFGILDRAGARVPIFIDKMLAANWSDSQAIVADATRRGVPLMAGSVLPYTPLDRPLRPGGVAVGIAVAAGPYWAYAFHAAELLQGFMEQRGAREPGISEVREVGRDYWIMPDRDRWGGKAFDALLPTARTRSSRAPAIPGGLGSETHVVLFQYADGARAVLALIPRAFDEAEFLLGAQYSDGTIGTGGLILPRQPFDHFGYLVRALADFYTTGRPTAPVERALLTSGMTLLGQEARRGGSIASPALAISYSPGRTRP